MFVLFTLMKLCIWTSEFYHIGYVKIFFRKIEKLFFYGKLQKLTRNTDEKITNQQHKIHSF